MNAYETVKITDKELMTVNNYGEKIVAKLQDEDTVIFYHHDYKKREKLQIISMCSSIYAICEKLTGNIVSVNINEFTWMLKARYELLNKKEI